MTRPDWTVIWTGAAFEALPLVQASLKLKPMRAVDLSSRSRTEVALHSGTLGNDGPEATSTSRGAARFFFATLPVPDRSATQVASLIAASPVRPAARVYVSSEAA